MRYKSESVIIFTVLFFLLIMPYGFGQQLPDSLKLLEDNIGTISSDSELLDVYITLAGKYTPMDPEKGVFYSKEALSLAKKRDDIDAYAEACIAMSINLINIGQADSSMYYSRKVLVLEMEGKVEGFTFYAHNALGNAHNELGNTDSAFYFYNLVLEHAKASNKQSQLATAYNNIGMLYSDQGEIEKCYESYLRALKIFEQIGDEENISKTLNNIATVNQVNKEYRKSIEYLDRAAEINVKNGFSQSLSMNYSNLGIAYKNLESYDTALYYYKKTIEINQKYGYGQDLARDYFNVGNLYLKKEDYESARKYLEKSMAESEKYGVKMGELYNHLQLSKIDIIQGKLDIAAARLKQIDALIEETGHGRLKEEALLRKSSFYEKKGDLNNALIYYQQYHDFTDSLQKLSYKGNIAEIQEKYESDKKDLENQKLKDQNLLNKKVIQNQRLIGFAVIITLVLSAMLAITFFRSRQKVRRAFGVLKKLNKEVVKQKEELQKANETKDKMFSVVAHDLRSPFNSLIGFLSILVDEFEELDDDEKEEMLGVVYNQSLNTYGLLENLLQWSMMQRGMVKFHFEEYDLHQIVASQIGDLRARAKTKQVSIVNNVLPGTKIYIDENMGKTIFRNLINNALKFTKPKGVISVEAQSSPDETKVIVSDTGIGMDEELVSGIFKMNTCKSAVGTDNEKGSGLGLQIVRDFMELLHADIHVESQLGKGSVFYLSFKTKAAHPGFDA